MGKMFIGMLEDILVPGFLRESWTQIEGWSDVSFGERVVAWLPQGWLVKALAHAELLKFLSVGAITFVSTVVIFFGLKWTVLPQNPVTANILAVLVSTILSYVLNREWSFSNRGGRPQHHEAALFFGVAGVGLALNQVPLWISRYILDLRTPHVSFIAENLADLVSGTILGTLIATAFRWWAMSKFVFLHYPTQSAETVDSETVDSDLDKPA